MRIARAERLVVAVLLAWLPVHAGAAELGALFYTPEERARLDRMRRGEPIEHAGAVPGARAVTGFVKRSDGRGTVWIDGVPMQIADPKAGTLLEPRVVRGYANRDDPGVKIERKTPP
jgi:hypothetical protein